MAARKRKAAKVKTKGKKATHRDRYKDTFPEILKMLVVDSGLVNLRGEIAWTKVAKGLGVARDTIYRWLNRKVKKHYKPAFAAAAKACADEVEAGRIKRSLIDRAKGYTQTTRMKENRETPDGDINVDRVTKTKVGCDVAAARICLANLGPKEDRWTEKHQVDVADARLTDTECDNIRAVLARNLEGS